MRITSIGHAGLFIESAAGSIVCDPWFTPAYFGSWVPFPDNTGVDPARLAAADYLYISHLHHDHYDPQWLSRYMRKDITVLLPEFPVPDLHHALAGLGFKNFVQTRHNQPLVLDSGLRVQSSSVDAPLDGPLGDSGIALDDGRVRLFNQNDSRPIELRPIQEFGPLHAHLVQYSGAIWFPGAYTFPERVKRTLGTRKRRNGMARALRYIEQLGAEHVLPFAGPACFLDDELWHLNDFDGDPANPFPDQFAFLEFLQEQGFDRAHLFLTGTEVDLHPDGTARVAQIPDEEVARIRDDRRGYLAEYQRKVQPAIDAITRALPQDRSDLVAQLKEYVEPLMKEADHTCAASTAGFCWRWRPSTAARTRTSSSTSWTGGWTGTRARRRATSSGSAARWWRSWCGGAARTGWTSCSCPAAWRSPVRVRTTTTCTRSSNPSPRSTWRSWRTTTRRPTGTSTTRSRTDTWYRGAARTSRPI
ncbi:hypothetical protein FS847_05525 [Streptomyces sp. ISID311]|nr:hypothetical protein FS847_05525 [Streptomyces sp. ISID311]